RFELRKDFGGTIDAAVPADGFQTDAEIRDSRSADIPGAAPQRVRFAGETPGVALRNRSANPVEARRCFAEIDPDDLPENAVVIPDLLQKVRLAGIDRRAGVEDPLTEDAQEIRLSDRLGEVVIHSDSCTTIALRTDNACGERDDGC